MDAILQSHVSHATVSGASNLQTMYPTNPIHHTKPKLFASIPSHMGGPPLKQEYTSEYLQIGQQQHVVSPTNAFPAACHPGSTAEYPNQSYYHPPPSGSTTLSLTAGNPSYNGATDLKAAKSINMTMQTSDESWRGHSRTFVKRTLFKSVKFWDTRSHGGFSLDPRTVCGMMAAQFNFGPQVDQNQWWLTCIPWIMRMLTDHRNNCIKAMRKKYKGEYQ